MQGRNRGADVENKLGDTVGEGEGRVNCESSTDIRTLPCVKQTASGELSLVFCGGPAWWECGGREAGSRVRDHLHTYS